MFNSDSYSCFHCVVCHSSICSCNFFNSVVVNAFFTLLECKSWELHITIFIVAYSFNNFTCWIFQYEAEFVSFKLTTFQTFSEVEFHFNWNVIYTFFSWFAWFFNSFAYRVVVVDYLSCSIFDVWSTWYISFNCCWDIKFVVTSKGEFSCVNDLSIFCIAKWLREACFKSCSHHTIFNLDVEFVCYIVTSYWVICFDCWTIYINFCFIEVISNSYWLNVFFVSCWEFSCI